MAARRVDMGMGFAPPARKLKYRRLENKIQRLKRQYRHGSKTMEQYWSAVTHLIGHFA